MRENFKFNLIKHGWKIARKRGISTLIQKSATFSKIQMLYLFGEFCIRYDVNPLQVLRFGTRIRSKLPGHQISDAAPYKILFIDPNTITHISPMGKGIIYGRVQGGDWDQSTMAFKEEPEYKSLKAVICEDVPLSETILFDKFTAKVRNGSAWGKTSIHEFDKREEEIEQLCKNIKQEGYKTQLELLEESFESVVNENNDTFYPILNEVHIDLDREGKPLWRHKGRHRLAIAQILNVDKIPVIVGTRHAKWQEIRDHIRGGNIDNSLPFLNHPDLKDII